jgi:L-iditol 2-dehydrogenase
MLTYRLTSRRNIQSFEEPCPVPEEGQQILRITSVGICGSDLHWFKEGEIGDATLENPLILGHEFAAITQDGIRVAVDPSSPCLGCEACQKGHPNLCPNVRFAGHGSIDGALREWMAWDSHCIFPIPDAMSNEEAAMLEPLGVAIHAVDLAHLKIGMTVAIFGSGPIGLLILQLVKLSGAIPVLVTDRLHHRNESAIRFGADQSVLVSTTLDNSVLRELIGTRGVDVAFEVAGNQCAVDDAFEAVTVGGKVVLVGIPEDDHTHFSASLARRKGVTIKMVRRMKFTYPRAIDLVSKGLVDVKTLITHRFPLAQTQQAFETAERRDGLKVIINI